MRYKMKYKKGKGGLLLYLYRHTAASFVAPLTLQPPRGCAPAVASAIPQAGELLGKIWYDNVLKERERIGKQNRIVYK
jgi:hypothetical protein